VPLKHLFLFFFYKLLLLRLFYGCIDLRAHRRGLGLNRVSRLLEFFLGKRMSRTDAEG
jgi:hypothetical protein